MTWTNFGEMSPIVDMTLTRFEKAKTKSTSFPFFSGAPDEPFTMTWTKVCKILIENQPVRLSLSKSG